MKLVKAYVSRYRIAEVLETLRESGVCDIGARSDCHYLTVTAVQRPFAGAEPSQQHYSIDLAAPVVTEYRIELVCADAQATELVEVIAKTAASGQRCCGWIVVSELEHAVEIK